MKYANEAAIKCVEQRSPRGRFHLFRRHISEALGAPRDTGVAGGGHPFDVELARLPPGATNFPFHAHAAQWEVYIVISGSGELRAGDTVLAVTAEAVADGILTLEPERVLGILSACVSGLIRSTRTGLS